MSNSQPISLNDAKHQNNISATEADGVRCELDGVFVHSVAAYLKVVHPDVSIEQYQQQFPDAPLVSERLKAVKQKQETEMAMSKVVPLHNASHSHYPPVLNTGSTQKDLHKAFDLGEDAPGIKRPRGGYIQVTVLNDPQPDFAGYVEPVDEKYVFNIDLLKCVTIAVELNKPLLLWGKHGTGKTSIAEQYCARTNRPVVRIQHTVSTEEAHVVGQYVVKGGETVFEPGLLALAMRYGLVYIADEYDFALPSVLSLYQPVLEGKKLVIKEAPPEWRVIHPHPNFRFIATGNTNGGGDETGLYQGTQLQNAANYSRFGVTVEVGYMPAKLEAAAIADKGKVYPADAEKLVAFGEHVRSAFARQDISNTVSPRELINAAQIAGRLGGKFREALNLAFINRLNSIDRNAVASFADRIFAEA